MLQAPRCVLLRHALPDRSHRRRGARTRTRHTISRSEWPDRSDNRGGRSNVTEGIAAPEWRRKGSTIAWSAGLLAARTLRLVPRSEQGRPPAPSGAALPWLCAEDSIVAVGPPGLGSRSAGMLSGLVASSHRDPRPGETRPCISRDERRGPDPEPVPHSGSYQGMAPVADLSGASRRPWPRTRWWHESRSSLRALVRSRSRLTPRLRRRRPVTSLIRNPDHAHDVRMKAGGGTVVLNSSGPATARWATPSARPVPWCSPPASGRAAAPIARRRWITGGVAN